MKKTLSFFLIISLFVVSIAAQTKPRARDLGVPFDGATGQFNAITDVKGVEVGYTTLISGEGKTAIRTGVTAILPQGKTFQGRIFAGWYALNGNGEMTGTTWIEESGGLGSPIMITNTHSVGVVRDAVIEWGTKRFPGGIGYSGDFSLPVVAETYDGFLSDINGFHVKKEHVFQALDTAKTGAIAEGNVGGGTGMMAHGFKGGTGTASRRLDAKIGGYTVGVMVQANYGTRQFFSVAGVPVGREITDLRPTAGQQPTSGIFDKAFNEGQGSIIVVVATDAPLLPHQLKRLAQRVSLGVGNMGGRGENSSGDIFIAFSTANAAEASKDKDLANLTMLPNEQINPLFWATVQATEEAILNALVAAETMKGYNGNTAYALPHDRLKEALKKYNRLQEVKKMNLQEQIEQLFAKSEFTADDRKVFEDFKAALRQGEIRAAEKDSSGNWQTNAWVKQGILLGFKMGAMVEMSQECETFQFFDKDTYPLRPMTLEDKIRIVPGGSTIRDGSFVAPNVVLMPPCYVNVGAFVDEGTMIDSHALVGSCAQIGKRVHLSAAAQIGGVLEPINANPVVIEDDVLVGGNTGVYEGAIVRERAVLASGVILTRSTPVFDLVNEKIIKSDGTKPLEIPAGAVVVQGSRQITSGFGKENALSIYAPIIVKYRDEKTDASTKLEDYLR